MSTRKKKIDESIDYDPNMYFVTAHDYRNMLQLNNYAIYPLEALFKAAYILQHEPSSRKEFESITKKLHKLFMNEIPEINGTRVYGGLTYYSNGLCKAKGGYLLVLPCWQTRYYEEEAEREKAEKEAERLRVIEEERVAALKAEKEAKEAAELAAKPKRKPIVKGPTPIKTLALRGFRSAYPLWYAIYQERNNNKYTTPTTTFKKFAYVADLNEKLKVIPDEAKRIVDVSGIESTVLAQAYQLYHHLMSYIRDYEKSALQSRHNHEDIVEKAFTFLIPTDDDFKEMLAYAEEAAIKYIADKERLWSIPELQRYVKEAVQKYIDKISFANKPTLDFTGSIKQIMVNNSEGHPMYKKVTYSPLYDVMVTQVHKITDPAVFAVFQKFGLIHEKAVFVAPEVPAAVEETIVIEEVVVEATPVIEIIDMGTKAPRQTRNVTVIEVG